MKRREFLAARAQAPSVPRIGYIWLGDKGRGTSRRALLPLQVAVTELLS